MIFRSTLLGIATAALFATMPAAAQAADGFAQASGTLRAGPSSSYPSVGYVSRGESLVIYGCIAGYTWCDVYDGEDRGWFPGNRIEFLADGRRVLLPRYAPVIGLAILGFTFDSYWNDYYRDRPWYREQRWWHRHKLPPPPPPGGHPPPGPGPGPGYPPKPYKPPVIGHPPKPVYKVQPKQQLHYTPVPPKQMYRAPQQQKFTPPPGGGGGGGGQKRFCPPGQKC